jgi:hypothetical protein
MKYCPNCQTRYTDNTLRFCLQDGAPLAESVDENFAPTVSYGENVQLIARRNARGSAARGRADPY